MLSRMSLTRSTSLFLRRYGIAASQQIRWHSVAIRPLVASQNGALGARISLPPHLCRYFSSSAAAADIVDDKNPEKPIRILFGSQGGTAQIFAIQLADALEEAFPNRPVEMFGLHEHSKNLSQTLDPNSINVILTSVAGVGEPPDNARAFYEWLLSDAANADAVDYTVFGLGNLKAHPNHFNVIGKNIDARLQELGATRVHEMGLGDDGECIEDDFDVWLGHFLQSLSKDGVEDSVSSTTEATEIVREEQAKQQVAEYQKETKVPPSTSHTARVPSTKYPELTLQQPQADVVREDLFHLQSTTKPFYQNDFEKLTVADNRLLSVKSAEYGLREMVVNLSDDTTYYEAGDHFVLYPKNSYCLVEAYLEMFGVDPHVIIEPPADKSGKAYPLPTGITLFETLLHCVDLGAVPSPTFSRELLGRKDIDYKNDIANPRRTILDLALESGNRLSLDDFLYNFTPMQPRYYSIASSPLVHPTQVYLTYRPVKYVSTRGAIREGTCTTYMVNLAGSAEIIGAIRSNPSFRLPMDPAAPVLLMAGGCGIAAIRSFLEERLAQAGTQTFGRGHLFLGFRSPSDEVYREMVDKAVEVGVLTNAQVSYTSGCVGPNQQCRLVSETVRANGKQVWDLFESGGYTYLCGGARTFGAAIEREVIRIIQEHGNMNEEEAIEYLRQLIKEGRFCEDLAD